MPITVRSRIRPRTAHDFVGEHTEVCEIEATGGSYDEARDALFAQIPDAWVALGISSSAA